MKQTATKFKIPNILMFGAPGVGKGTYGGMLVKDINYKSIATGDAIRSFLKKDDLTPELQEIQAICRRGDLISDDKIMQIVNSSLSSLKHFEGVIFDGFPRNVAQARLFSDIIDIRSSYVVNLELDESVLIEKLGGRRVCKECGEGYNFCNIDRNGYKMSPLLPKNGKTCDCCGGELIQREDDNEQVIASRLELYNKETQPVLEIFKSMEIPILNFEPKNGKKDYRKLLERIQTDFISGF